MRFRWTAPGQAHENTQVLSLIRRDLGHRLLERIRLQPVNRPAFRTSREQLGPAHP